MSASKRKPRLQLVLDWDGTMTTADTTAVIGATLISRARALAPASASADELPAPMSSYGEQYAAELEAWQEKNPSPSAATATSDQRPTPRPSVADEVASLSRSKPVEQDSYLRVRTALLNTPGGAMRELESDAFKRDRVMMDVGRAAVRNGEVSIRDPDRLRRLLAKAEEQGNLWGIVSVSWSRRFILGALIEAGLVRESEADEVAGRIRCNELLAPGIYDGEKRLVILCSAQDKEDSLKSLLAEWAAQIGEPEDRYSHSGNQTVTLYVGDSLTDIGCLAGPCVGMYIKEGEARDDSMLKTLERLGINCLAANDLPIDDNPTTFDAMMSKLPTEGRPPHLIYKIADFQRLAVWAERVF